MNYTASEHARLVLAEGLRFFSNATQEQTEEFAEAVQEAIEAGDAHDIIAMLACSAVEGWTRYADAVRVPAPEMFKQVFANWAKAEDEWRSVEVGE